MERPNFSNKRADEYREDDKELANLMRYVHDHVLNISAWKFHNPKTGKQVSHADVIDGIREKIPDMEWVETMRYLFRNLPARMELISREMKVVFKNFTINLGERLDLLLAHQDYFDELEATIEERNKMIAELQKEMESLRHQKSFGDIIAHIGALQKQVDALANKEVVVKIESKKGQEASKKDSPAEEESGEKEPKDPGEKWRQSK